MSININEPQENTISKTTYTASILGGTVFYATENGIDPEFPEYDDLLPNGMYIRIESSNGKNVYISAYEIDKAISIIGEMSMDKASNEELEELKIKLTEKASNFDLEFLQSEVGTKASKVEVDNLLDTFNSKADKSSVENVVEQLELKADKSSVENVVEQLELKADKSSVENVVEQLELKADTEYIITLVNDIEALKNTLLNLSDQNSIVAIKNQIEYLRSEINKKLTSDDLYKINLKFSDISNEILEIDGRLTKAENDIQKKASTVYVQGQVSELNNAITGIAKRLDGKADKSAVNSKAERSDLESAVKRLTTLNNTVSELEINIDKRLDTIEDEFDNKTNKSYVDEIASNLSNDIANKADKNSTGESINRINSKLTSLEESHTEDFSKLSGSINELQCETNNSLSEIRKSINTQSRTITQLDKDITSLESTTLTHTEQLKQPWVRVLTTLEYKNLRPDPGNVPYNNRYKYPNIVYFIVDFNKPKAIYIGDIKIAQAEQNGSLGFAYNFPIVF